MEKEKVLEIFRGLGIKLWGWLKEGVEEFVKLFIHKELDPIVADPELVWLKYGKDVEKAIEAAVPGVELDDEVKLLVKLGVLKAVSTYSADVRAKLLGWAEQINPGD